MDGVAARVERNDQLDEAHHRDRREEVQADHPLGGRYARGELSYGDRGCVRRDDRGSCDVSCRLGEYRGLQPGVLRHRFDDDIRLRYEGEVSRELDTGKDAVAANRIKLALCNRSCEGRLDSGARQSALVIPHFAEDYRETGCRRGLGYSSTHQATAQHRYLLNRHPSTPDRLLDTAGRSYSPRHRRRLRSMFPEQSAAMAASRTKSPQTGGSPVDVV